LQKALWGDCVPCNFALRSFPSPIPDVSDAELETLMPETVNIRLFNACNLKCKYCLSYHGDSIDFSNKTFLTLFDYFIRKNAQLRNIAWMGGEFFADAQGREFIKATLSEFPRLKFFLITNGVAYDRETLESCLVDVNQLASIDVSLYGASNSAYEKYTGGGVKSGVSWRGRFPLLRQTTPTWVSNIYLQKKLILTFPLH
jgi:MoaA/NifB/PqqE/SkfB family radical SAM enzyme